MSMLVHTNNSLNFINGELLERRGNAFDALEGAKSARSAAKLVHQEALVEEQKCLDEFNLLDNAVDAAALLMDYVPEQEDK